MAKILIFYASIEGQAARIADRMAAVLRSRGHVVEACRALHHRDGLDLASYDGVIVGASVHYGHHPAFLRALLRGCRRSLEQRPNAFFSVSLSGGGPGAKPEVAQRYLATFLHQAGWQPQQTAIFAGALWYTRYPAWKRALLRLIVGMAGGDTDASRDYEYTDWTAVERFAEQFAEQFSARLQISRAGEQEPTSDAMDRQRRPTAAAIR